MCNVLEESSSFSMCKLHRYYYCIVAVLVLPPRVAILTKFLSITVNSGLSCPLSSRSLFSNFFSRFNLERGGIKAIQTRARGYSIQKHCNMFVCNLRRATSESSSFFRFFRLPKTDTSPLTSLDNKRSRTEPKFF